MDHVLYMKIEEILLMYFVNTILKEIFANIKYQLFGLIKQHKQLGI